MRNACLARVVSMALHRLRREWPAARHRRRQRWPDAAGGILRGGGAGRPGHGPPPRRGRQRRHLPGRPQRPLRDARHQSATARPMSSRPSATCKGTEVRMFKNWLYVSDDVGVYRYPLKKGELAPAVRARPWSANFRKERQHADKTFALDAKGTLYIERRRAFELLPGEGPAGRFAGSESLPDPREVRRRVGVRRQRSSTRRPPTAGASPPACAMPWPSNGTPTQNALFAVIHGRDSIDTLFPALYNAEDNATAPGGGIPPDRRRRQLRLAVHLLRHQARQARGRARNTAATRRRNPKPASIRIRWSRFPRTGRLTTCCSIRARISRRSTSEGAFIAFHGSWNRAPEPQAGYKVVFQPMKDGKPNGAYEVFADGFAGRDEGQQSAQRAVPSRRSRGGAGWLAVRFRFAEGSRLADLATARNDGAMRLARLAACSVGRVLRSARSPRQTAAPDSRRAGPAALRRALPELSSGRWRRRA